MISGFGFLCMRCADGLLHVDVLFGCVLVKCNRFAYDFMVTMPDHVVVSLCFLFD